MKISGCKHVISYRNQNLNSPKFLGTKLTKIKIWPVLYQIPYVRMHMLYVPELCWWRKVVAVCKGYLGDGQGRSHWPREGRKRPQQLHWAHPRHIHFHLEWIHHPPKKWKDKSEKIAIAFFGAHLFLCFSNGAILHCVITSYYINCLFLRYS